MIETYRQNWNDVLFPSHWSVLKKSKKKKKKEKEKENPSFGCKTSKSMVKTDEK